MSSVVHKDRDRAFRLGESTFTTILAFSDETEGRHDFTDTYQGAGHRTPLHMHTRYEERFWVVEGSLHVWAGDEVLTLRSGDFYAIAMGTPHALQMGPTGCRALQVSSPAGLSELIRRAGIPERLVNAGLTFTPEPFGEVAADLGDIILGPPGAVPGSRT
ncbi:cupin domain-containing protein [Streptomyces sp. NPDC017991]|uniref:cupin domain-containing protein n=1 Tax=Streptomyces sp. NPDC017991 TaxID=3365026 RepID=UPI0037AECD23